MRDRVKCSLWRVIAFFLGLYLSGCDRGQVELGKTEYRYPASSPRCKTGTRAGKAGISNDEATPKGFNYTVRTPSNYDSSYPHPLIVVYAPAGTSRFNSERMTRLTPAATAAGFLIAYADHQRMSGKTLIELAGIPEQIAEKWCVDRERIYLTGHSDGGNVAMGLAFLEDTRSLPAAIAPSAAGIRGSDLASYPCPEPISVLIMHSRNDELFPGFGREAAEWWAGCNQCAKNPRPTKPRGCIEYPGCKPNVETWYCEGEAPHTRWPALNAKILKFFSTQSNPPREGS